MKRYYKSVTVMLLAVAYSLAVPAMISAAVTLMVFGGIILLASIPPVGFYLTKWVLKK